MSTETRLCPVCFEEIRSKAIKCKHCGSAELDLELRRSVGRWDELSKADRESEWLRLTPEERVRLQVAVKVVQQERPAAPRGSLWWILVIAVGVVLGNLIASGLVR
jgi:hypothetical protein